MDRVSKSDYLKKYMSGGAAGDSNKKKKSKKDKPKNGAGINIVVEDAFTVVGANAKPELDSDEEAEIKIEAEIKHKASKMGQFRNAFAPVGGEVKKEPESVSNSPENRPIKNNDPSPSRVRRTRRDSDASPIRRTRRDSDNSPVRTTRVRRDSDESPVGRKRKDSDASPPRHQRRDSDASPPRRTRKDSDSSPIRKRRERRDSPERRARKESPRRSKKESPPRRGRKDDDNSPVRRRRDSDESPPRKQRRSPEKRKRRDSDQSPPRNRRESPSRGTRRRRDSDNSPKRRRNDDSDASPPRQRRRRDSENSPPRKRNDDSDASPPRQRRRRNSDNSPPRRNDQWSDSRRRVASPTKVKDEPLSPSERTRAFTPTREIKEEEGVTRTLEGKKAGLQSAKDLREESDQIRAKNDQMFTDLPSEISGKDAQTVERRKMTGKNRERPEDKERKEREAAMQAKLQDKYRDWSKGVAQAEARAALLEEMARVAAEPLARAKDDEAMNEHLKQEINEKEDPMAKFLLAKKRNDDIQHGRLVYPRYEGGIHPNRFGIRPGYRWDGVQRGNGFEGKLAVQGNKKSADEKEYYQNIQSYE